MSRLRADALLFFTAIIWGFAFIAQKTGMNGLGPFGFGGGRFLLSLIVILPFLLREERKPVDRTAWFWSIPLCLCFFGGVIFQQLGLQTTSVTNAGFLTGLYVIFTPILAWVFFRQAPRAIVWVACLVACLGTYLLGGGHLDSFHTGDWLVVGSAVAYAGQILCLGFLVQRTRRPMLLMAMQYATCAVLGIGIALFTETVTWEAISANGVQLLYAGIISGGIAYTLQGVAQQYAPASDAAIIMSTEALFAALGGALVLGDRLSVVGWAGCALIFCAVLMVETAAYLVEKRRKLL